MIYSLLQEQTNRVMNKDGATVLLLPLHTVPLCSALLRAARLLDVRLA